MGAEGQRHGGRGPRAEGRGTQTPVQSWIFTKLRTNIIQRDDQHIGRCFFNTDLVVKGGSGWDESKRVQRNLEKFCKNARELATFSENQLQNRYFPKKYSENFVFRMLACAKKWWMKMVLRETFLVSFQFQVYFYVRVLEFVCVCSGVVVCVTKCLCMCLYFKCN